jgi:hypothetical protein
MEQPLVERTPRRRAVVVTQIPAKHGDGCPLPELGFLVNDLTIYSSSAGIYIFFLIYFIFLSLVDTSVPQFNSLIPSGINIVAILCQPSSLLLAEKLSRNQVVGK